MGGNALTDLRRVAKRKQRLEEEWRRGIVRARAQGHSLRAIGEAAGVTHVAVLKLMQTFKEKP